jgi:hypothetical protein
MSVLVTTDQDRRREMTADTASAIVPVTAGETILQQETREISIAVAREDVTVTHARYAAGERVAGPHVHHHGLVATRCGRSPRT